MRQRRWVMPLLRIARQSPWWVVDGRGRGADERIRVDARCTEVLLVLPLWRVRLRAGVDALLCAVRRRALSPAGGAGADDGGEHDHDGRDGATRARHADDGG